MMGIKMQKRDFTEIQVDSMAKKSLGTILGELYKSFFITNPGLQVYTEAQLAQGRASEEATIFIR